MWLPHHKLRIPWLQVVRGIEHRKGVITTNFKNCSECNRQRCERDRTGVRLRPGRLLLGFDVLGVDLVGSPQGPKVPVQMRDPGEARAMKVIQLAWRRALCRSRSPGMTAELGWAGGMTGVHPYRFAAGVGGRESWDNDI